MILWKFWRRSRCCEAKLEWRWGWSWKYDGWVCSKCKMAQ